MPHCGVSVCAGRQMLFSQAYRMYVSMRCVCVSIVVSDYCDNARNLTPLCIDDVLHSSCPLVPVKKAPFVASRYVLRDVPAYTLL